VSVKPCNVLLPDTGWYVSLLVSVLPLLSSAALMLSILAVFTNDQKVGGSDEFPI